MKYKTIWLAAIIFYSALQISAYASPVFPAADNEPLAKTAEKADMPVETVQQNTSTENANLHKDNSYGLAQIEFKILFGTNQDGEKSYKTTYQLAQVSGDKNAVTPEPVVRVTYKNKADKDKFAVEEVFIRKMANNAYQITGKIVEIKPGETIVTKVTWLN